MGTQVQVIEKNPGRKIDFEQRKTKIVFGDDDLSVRCDTRQRDWPVHLDICMDKDRNLVIGVGTGLYYVAQVDIPPIRYEEAKEMDGGGEEQERRAVPLDMGDVVLTLWSLDDLEPAAEAAETRTEET